MKKKTPIDLFADHLRSKGIFITTDDLHTFKSEEKIEFKSAYQQGYRDACNEKLDYDYYDTNFEEFKCNSDLN